MRGERFTQDEITLCAYAARFDVQDIGGVKAIRRLSRRGEGSIRMKIQNIASMLDEENIPRESNVSPLTGRPPGATGRRTNWEWVEPLALLPRDELLSRCRILLAAQRGRA